MSNQNITEEEREQLQKLFQCHICKKLFTVKRNLGTHTKEVHLKSKVICDICKKSFTRPFELKCHQEKDHFGIIPSFQCLQCDWTFTQAFKRKRHVLSVHEGQKPFLCEKCPKSFTNKVNMLNHVKTIHEENVTYECALCKKRYKQKMSFIKHMNLHDKKNSMMLQITMFQGGKHEQKNC